jgi:hypothetical protein
MPVEPFRNFLAAQGVHHEQLDEIVQKNPSMSPANEQAGRDLVDEKQISGATSI